MAITTWRKEIEIALKGGDTVEGLTCTLTDEELDTSFDAGFGWSQGKPFTAWGDKYVYFPVVYDGAEWVGSAPRHPNNEATDHLGSQ